MIRRPPRSTLDRSSAASDVYKRQIKYSTIQNWYPGDKDGKGGIYNFVTKRGRAMTDSKITWTQVETGSAITWKYPSCILPVSYTHLTLPTSDLV